MSKRLSLIVLLLAAGCMPTFRYEPKPLTLPPETDAERCYQAKRIGFAAGSARWMYQTSTPGFYSTTVTTHRMQSSGITVYVGDRHLSAVESVDLLEDMELRASYRRELDRTAGAHRMYPFWRNLSLGMGFAGLGMAGVGLTKVLIDNEDRSGLWWAIGGAAVAVAAMIPAIFAGQTYEDAVEHAKMKQLFTVSSLAPRFRDAALRYNQKVASSCGHDGVDLPGGE
jgi:hypothetical protein